MLDFMNLSNDVKIILQLSFGYENLYILPFICKVVISKTVISILNWTSQFLF